MRLATVAFFLVACSSNPTTTEPTAPAPVVESNAIVVVESAPPSSCDTQQACEAECAAASVSACTLAARSSANESPGKARIAYESSCAKHDPLACTLLAELSVDVVESDRYRRLACGAGDQESCSFLSELSLLAFAAPRAGEDPQALVALSEQTAKRACKLGSYEGCFNAVALLGFREADSAEIQTTATSGLLLAEGACAERRIGACQVVAEWADRAGDREAAIAAYTGQCSMDRKVLAADKVVEDIVSCQRAGELSGSFDQIKAATVPAAEPADKGRERLVTQRALDAVRASGKTQIQPIAEEQRAINLTGKPGVAVLRLCISKVGRISTVSFLRPSPYANWNRKLFEAIREWRYSPFTVEGVAKAVCSTTTFAVRNQ